MDIEAQLQLIGSLLVKKGILPQSQLDELAQLLSTEEHAKSNFENILIEKELVTEEQLLRIYSDQFNYPFISLKEFTIEPSTVNDIPAKFANQNTLIALKKEDDQLTVALRNPFEINVLDDLKMFTKCDITPVLCLKEEIEEAIKTHYGVGAETIEKLVRAKGPETAAAEISSSTLDFDELVKDTSMVKYVNQLLFEAFEQRATDIHIEPFKDRLRIRHRIDGILYEANTPAELIKLQDAIISRFKIMSNLDIAEKRRPQDGRCMVSLNGKEVDLRLSTFPTLHGEGLSIRLLSRDSILLSLGQLGLSQNEYDRFQTTLKKSNGIILVTGPTGCGKTTTLYACMNYLNKVAINIVSLEDPIEYQLEGINQIQTNNKVDLTFANGFRSILRQDPDVVLVGEIRDSETAQIAMRAALTGHLILSTLHTNNAVATLSRLLDLGVEPYFLTHTLKCVIAQRLVRIICPECKEKYHPDGKLLQALGLSHEIPAFFKGNGCPECNQTGYRGRMAIFEVLFIDESLAHLINTGASQKELFDKARDNGMRSLQNDGFDKIKQGLTTIDEVIRVTG